MTDVDHEGVDDRAQPDAEPPEKDDEPYVNKRGTFILDRIAEITKNGRSIWFTLLGALAFIGLAVSTVSPQDFYMAERATQLPVINTPVPTLQFFGIAAWVLLAVYSYFHMYTLKLWDELGEAPVTVNGWPLADFVHPWLMSDAALVVRRFLRCEYSDFEEGWEARRAAGQRDFPVRRRVVTTLSMVSNVLLAWGAVPLVLGLTWWQSFYAPGWALPVVTGLAFFLSLGMGAHSLMLMIDVMAHGKEPARQPPRAPGGRGVALVFVVLSAGVVGGVTYDRLGPEALVPSARISLVNAQITKRPEDWHPHALAEGPFYDQWCKRPLNRALCTGSTVPTEFLSAWSDQRRSALQALPRNFARLPQGAEIDATGAFLAGHQFKARSLERWTLDQATMEAVTLEDVNARGLTSSTANWALARVRRGTTFDGASFRHSDMTGFHVNSGASFVGTDFSNATLENAFFSADTPMDGSLFVQTDMHDIVGIGRVERSYFNGSDYGGFYHWEETAPERGTGTQFGSIVGGGRVNLLMTGEIGSLFVDVGDSKPSLQNSDNWIYSDNLSGSALRFYDASDETTFFFLQRQVFADGSVKRPADQDRPCHWHPRLLSDFDFFANWRAWLEASGQAWPPSDRIGGLQITKVDMVEQGDVTFVSGEKRVRVRDISPSDEVIAKMQSCAGAGSGG